MRTYEVTEYDYEDMIALENMTPNEVSDTLEDMYRGWFNRYVIPTSYKDDYTEEQYSDYKIQCAFNRVYNLLAELENTGKANNWSGVE